MGYTDTAQHFSLGQYITELQVEAYAFKSCPAKNTDRDYKNRNVYILSDSETAIKVFDKCHINCKLV
jgi:hypothetical protein